MKYTRAFTLIELLTVVAILGILSTLSLGALRSAQVRSRDTQRKADLNLIAQALDLQYADTRSLPGMSDGCQEPKRSTDPDEPWIAGLEAYLPSTQGKAYRVPRDPFYNKNSLDFYYSYTCSLDRGKLFTLSAILENKEDPDSNEGVYTLTR